MQHLAPVALAIGVFDGVHRGHQDLIHRMVTDARARGLEAVCVTFDPDPETLVHPEHPCLALSSVPDRERLLMSLGVDRVSVVAFTPVVAAQTPEEFLHDLRSQMDMRQLWVGADFALGHERTGSIGVLSSIALREGFTVVALSLLTHDQREISSTWVRDSLADGNVELAAILLGRAYEIDGVVQPGAQRGRLLGFPTANLAPPPGRALPSDGVYFVEVRLLGGSSANGASSQANASHWHGVVNLGSRPTFGEEERLLETHLLDFQGELYGAHMVVAFVQKLRGVQKFSGIDELRAQIERDVAVARRLAAH